MDAKKCDLCGAFYESNNKLLGIALPTYVNGPTNWAVAIEVNFKIGTNRYQMEPKDLCDGCRQSILRKCTHQYAGLEKIIAPPGTHEIDKGFGVVL
jgi:hypothetical protein